MENIQINTSLKVSEENDSGTFANINTPQRGFFIRPSENVPDRGDITGYYLCAASELGKLEWSQVSSTGVGPKSSVTQLSSINNSVTINGRSCKIVTQEIDNLGIIENETFTVNNVFVLSDSTILFNYSFVSDDPDQRPLVSVNDVQNGSFKFVITTFSSNAVGYFIINLVIL